MLRYKIILNPTSGGGRGRRTLKTIEMLLDRHQLAYSLVKTEKRWHAAELTVSAVQDGFDVVVAAGGDGTVNEVINGLIQSQELYGRSAYLGVLCVGRGNDFAGGAGIPQDLEEGVGVLAAGNTTKVDVGQIFQDNSSHGRYFGNCVGVGFDAMGTIQVAKLPRMGGLLSYLIAIIQTIYIYYKAPLLLIHYDGEKIQQRSLLVSVMNGHRLGGGFLMAPNASLSDGWLDLCMVTEVTKGQIFRLIPHFFKGTQFTQSGVSAGRARHVTIESLEGTMPVQTDGEILCVEGKFVDVTLHAQRIDVIVQKKPVS